jgi:hypothetical protein
MFEGIALVDNHVHPPLKDPSARPLASFFSEAGEDAAVVAQTQHTLFYRRALRELAGLLRCSPDEASVAAARGAHSPDAYLHLLVQDANIGALIVDEGYPPHGKMTVEEMGAAAGCEARRIVRLETLAESLFPQANGAASLSRAMLEQLDSGPPLVGLKTIIAYRCGLAVEEPAAEEAEACFRRVRSEAGETPRLRSRPLLNFLLLRALEWAADRGLPVQFHSGYGDRDLDLVLANPALLRPLLEDRRFARLKVVLLHASYPYTRAASYLASVYPNVFVDWSEANPMLTPVMLRRVLEELLALAPYTRLLYGSDAWGVPDWLWLGARMGRAALASVLEDEPDRDTIARRILQDNARQLYGLDSEP